MSGTGAQHLERREGVFGLRVRVPNDIRPLVGMVEVRRSLRTHDRFRARAQSALLAARLFEVFRLVKENATTLTPDAVQQMIAGALRDILANGLGLLSSTAMPAVLIPQQLAVGPTLDEAVGAYLEAKRKSWTVKTHVGRRTKLALLQECLGGETRLMAITAHDVRTFRDGVLRLRRHTGRARPISFSSKQTNNPLHRIDPKTAVLTFEPVLAFFRWATFEQGYLTANPAEGVRISAPKKPKGQKSRRPFTEKELTTLFTSPLFTGCASPSRRFEAGACVIKDARYWIPILAFYGGFRLGELVQLHVTDVRLDGPVPYLDVTEESSGTGATGDTKHVKSDAGVRKVPLHPDVMELGFANFVAGRRKLKGGSKRLFAEIGFGSDGQASTTFSKWFGRFMDKAGLSDPKLVFHSFRHAAEDAFRNAGQQKYVIDQIIGHSDGSTSSAYGDGVDLDVAYEAVKAMKLKVRLPELFSTG